MSWYTDCKLVNDKDGYVVEIFLNPNDVEFSIELLSNIKDNIPEIDYVIRDIIEEKFTDIKVTSVKLILGTLVVASIPFIPNTKVHAADAPPTASQQISNQPLSFASLGAKGIVTATRLNVRSGPSTTNSIISKLLQGNSVKVLDAINGWYKIQLSNGTVGWVSNAYLKIDAASIRQGKINIVINTAKSLVGTPYVWGGKSLQDGGFDCSGFTQYSYRAAGYDLNRVSRDQATQGVAVSMGNLQPGDLVFFSLAGDGRISHVGIYLGGGKMIHSPKTGDTVKITDITTSFWQTRFITARRIIQ
ncbi:MAG: SH3 domain-containing C40 family peptidase [Bacillota bacterium]|nr:SH3 domain-containing C40 family peptidase [Bacillota bacterium]